jgi:hypothetical protein
MSTVINAKIKHKRGTENSIPLLLDGELYLCTDVVKVYKGTPSGNVLLYDESKVSSKAELLTTPQKTTANINYYVDSTAGADTNDGLTVGTAFKTIAKAISKIPQIVNHNVTITIQSGTYNEDIVLSGFYGIGKINIVGASSTTNNYNVNSIYCINNTLNISVKWINFTTISKQYSMYAESCSYILFYYCNSTGANQNGVGVTASNALVQYCTISNKTNYGIITYCGCVSSLANSGASNATGLYASYAGTIGKSGTQPSGTIAETATEGGIIR